MGGSTKNKNFTCVIQFTVPVCKVVQSPIIADRETHLRRYEAQHFFAEDYLMDINVNASPITQVATTTAVGGPGIFGDGGDATAVTSQHADSSNIQLGDNHFPWGGGYDYGPDLNVNASPITQVADTTAVGGLGLFGDGGDALAFTHQDADIFNVQG
jgi:hypothetical protein